MGDARFLCNASRLEGMRGVPFEVGRAEWERKRHEPHNGWAIPQLLMALLGGGKSPQPFTPEKHFLYLSASHIQPKTAFRCLSHWKSATIFAT